MNVFALAAKIGLETEGYEKGLEIATKQFKDFADFTTKVADTVGKTFATAAKVGVAAVTTVAASLTALGVASIKSYADYEQLAGGIEKIFDQMDNTKIFQDSQNAWRDLNMSANDYLTTIIDVGANFASTMGDEKGYETARRGFVAISDYASGTGKNVDVLAEKFTMITRSASSYQSIADQFSGILPATSKDFLAQAQAAGFLSTKYKDLTKVPIAEYQMAVSLMLEKGVADLNLTGNTARETATTISGSIAAVKSTWQNLVTAFADPDADLGMYVDSFIDSILMAKDNIVPRIKELLPRLVEGIGILIDELGPIAGELITGLLPSLIQGAASLVANLIVRLPVILRDFGTALKEALKGALEEAGLEEVWVQIENGLNWISENKDTIIAALNAIGGAIAAAFAVGTVINFAESISSLMNPFTLLVLGIGAVVATVVMSWDEISAFLEDVGAAVDEAFTFISNAFTVGMLTINEAINAGADLITLPFQFIMENCRGLADTEFGEIVRTVSGKLEEISESFSTIMGGVKTALEEDLAEVNNFFSEQLNEAKTIVGDILSNIKDEFSAEMDEAKEAVSKAIDEIREFFNFSWELPHLKLPHFSVTGKFSLNPPTVPHFGIQWYKKAMDNPLILNGATIFGAMNGNLLCGGEAGREVVSGADTLMRMIQDAVATVRGSEKEKRGLASVSNYFNITVNGAKYDDISQLADDLMFEIQNVYDRRALTFG